MGVQATSRLRDSRLVVTELPDPTLQGKFPAEEMQIMAHLARECLQWDPEARPTMTEVVHILATIAPLRQGAKRRNLPIAAAFNLTVSSSSSLPATYISCKRHACLLPWHAMARVHAAGVRSSDVAFNSAAVAARREV
jgi:hypothetical protein